MEALKVRRYKPDWGGLDQCLDDPHRVGSENFDSLIGYLSVEHGPKARVSFWLVIALTGSGSYSCPPISSR